MTPERWARLEHLFHAARERDSRDRDAYLATECAGDAALRHDVESLLKQQEGTLFRDGVAAAASVVAGAGAQGVHEGRTIGTYVVGALLGSGGMGEVYRARDTRLGRDVAMKFLPDALSRHPDRLARFEREARILASLSHPHIGAIYGVEESEGLRGLVLELVEGTTLERRLGNGALPVDEALALARQIADALEAAHHRGVVHRDLKPANITIMPPGTAKVLDFGLAKFDRAAAGEAAALPVLATTEGVVLGTVAYMSPEQARGLAVDKRTDIWAFGCVLFEMLTGRRAFSGESAADVLGAITGSEPDWTLLPPAVPPRVRAVLERCLRKDAARRLHDIADARIEIEDALNRDDGNVSTGTATDRARTRTPWMVACIAAAAGLGAWLALSTRPSPSGGPERLAIPLPDNIALFGIGRGSSVAIAPDGRRIAYVGLEGGRRRLYVRSIDATTSTPLAGTEAASSPFFSPDGRWIAFLDGVPVGGLKKVSIDGDGPYPIFDRAGDGVQGFAINGGWWGADDSIVFSAENPTRHGLWRVAASGGAPERLTTRMPGEGSHMWPHVIPNGRAVVYTLWDISGFEQARVMLKPLPAGNPVALVEGGSYGRVVTSGDRAWLVYARNEVLHARAFDMERLLVTGPEVPVINGIFTNMSGGAHFSVSRDGRLAYVPGRLVEREKTLLRVERDGSSSEITTVDGLSMQHQLSPDGRRLVTIRSTPSGRDVWVVDLEGGPLTRLTLGGVRSFPIWAGARVIYTSAADGNLYWKPADPAAPEERLTTSPYQHIAGSVSPDGSLLAYSEDHPQTGRDLWLMSLREPFEARRLVATRAGEWMPRFSPDGRWLAYQSSMSGRFEIYVVSLSENRQFPVSTSGGTSPWWAPDGRELYFRASTDAVRGDVMTVSFEPAGAEPRIGRPRLLFSGNEFQGGDIGPDGRFVFLKATPQAASSRFIEVVSGWFYDLQVRAPAP